MTTHYRDLLFTPDVRAVQARQGSRSAYARADGAPNVPDSLGPEEMQFIARRDSFYMATVGASGWPYIQHRGGPVGFVKLLNERQIGFADFRGNRQYISLGNIASENRAALFFMDYPGRARLKVMGRLRAVELGPEPALAAALIDPSIAAKVERGLIIDIEAFDWNCPQHITPRFTAAEIEPVVSGLRAEIEELQAEIARLRQQAMT